MDNKNKGGKKLKMEKIKSPQLAFLKRSFSVFKEATELATLCGVDVAVVLGPQRNPSIAELNRKVTVMKNLVEAERRCGEELAKEMEAEKIKHWFEAPIEQLNLEQLEELKAKLVEMREKVTKKVEELMKESANPAPPLAGQDSSGGGGGGHVVFGGSDSVSSGSGVSHGFDHGEGPNSF